MAIYAVADTQLFTPKLALFFLSFDIPPNNEAWFLNTITLLYFASIAITAMLAALCKTVTDPYKSHDVHN